MADGKWVLIRTRQGNEKKAADLLTAKGILNYCPLNKMTQPWRDRGYHFYQPLFPGYLFACLNSDNQQVVRKVPGFMNFIYWLNEPVTLPVEEIDAIRNFLDEYSGIKLEKSQVNRNDRVRIIYGPLVIREGNSFEVRNSPISVILPSMGYILVAQERKRITTVRVHTKSRQREKNLLDWIRI